MKRAQSAALSARESTQTTAAPSTARLSAMPPPIFGLVPVTSATFPPSFIKSFARARSLLAWRRCCQKAFRGVENPGVDEISLGRFAFELCQSTCQAHPVQNLLLATLLNRGCRIVSPEIVVARAQSFEQLSIGVNVRVQEVIFLGQKRMRPSGGGHQHDSPRTLCQNSGCSATEIEQTPRRRRRWIQLRLTWRILEHRQAAMLCDYFAAVAIDRERNDRMRETLAVVVQIQN